MFRLNVLQLIYSPNTLMGRAMSQWTLRVDHALNDASIEHLGGVTNQFSGLLGTKLCRWLHPRCNGQCDIECEERIARSLQTGWLQELVGYTALQKLWNHTCEKLHQSQELFEKGVVMCRDYTQQ